MTFKLIIYNLLRQIIDNFDLSINSIRHVKWCEVIRDVPVPVSMVVKRITNENSVLKSKLNAITDDLNSKIFDWIKMNEPTYTHVDHSLRSYSYAQ